MYRKSLSRKLVLLLVSWCGVVQADISLSAASFVLNSVNRIISLLEVRRDLRLSVHLGLQHAGKSYPHSYSQNVKGVSLYLGLFIILIIASKVCLISFNSGFACILELPQIYAKNIPALTISLL